MIYYSILSNIILIHFQLILPGLTVLKPFYFLYSIFLTVIGNYIHFAEESIFERQGWLPDLSGYQLISLGLTGVSAG